MAEATKLRDDFERWATLSARMLVSGPGERARLVESENVEHEWNAADAHWYGMLLEDIDAGRMGRLARYRALCDEQRSIPLEEEDDRAVTLQEDEPVAVTEPHPADPADPHPAEPHPAEPHPSHPPPRQQMPSFARDLSPSGIDPVAPAAEQTATSLDLSALQSEAAAVAALGGSLEQYAWLCAELEFYSDRQDEVWAARNIHTDAGRRNVHRGWQQRLQHEAAERERHEGLLDQYRRVLTDEAGN